MSPGLTLNETVVALIIDGEALRCDTARFSTLALMDAWISLGSVVKRRLADERGISPGTVAGRIPFADAGR